MWIVSKTKHGAITEMARNNHASIIYPVYLLPPKHLGDKGVFSA
jgi:hypothetical protein